MAKNAVPTKTVEQRMTAVERDIVQINKKLDKLAAPFAPEEKKPEKVIFDGVKTMSQKEAETIPGHWEVRGREWVRIAD
jgi:hypothetical protein